MINSIRKIRRKDWEFSKLDWMLSTPLSNGLCLSNFINSQKDVLLLKDLIKKSDLIDPRRLFFDSSIWFRYAENSHDEHYLCEESRILTNFYNLTSALEFKEFQIRIFENSYLEPDAHNRKYEDVGHSSFVTPFLFHSETEMDENTSDKINFIKKSLNDLKIEEWSWNVLIADDKARPINGSFCKLEAIKTVLCKLPYKNLDVTCEFDANNIKLKFITGEVLNFHFQIKNTFENAKNSILEDKNNDLILLDYLFIDEDNEDKCDFGDKIIFDLSEKQDLSSCIILCLRKIKFNFTGRC